MVGSQGCQRLVVRVGRGTIAVYRDAVAHGSRLPAITAEKFDIGGQKHAFCPFWDGDCATIPRRYGSELRRRERLVGQGGPLPSPVALGAFRSAYMPPHCSFYGEWKLWHAIPSTYILTPRAVSTPTARADLQKY